MFLKKKSVLSKRAAFKDKNKEVIWEKCNKAEKWLQEM